MAKNELQALDKYKNQYITVSNTLLRAKETTNLLESKIEALSMFYMGKNMLQREKKDANGNPYSVNYVSIPVKEIISLMAHEYGKRKNADGKTYNAIRSAAISMKQKLYIIEDSENHNFALKSMYGDVAYRDGSFYVEFNPSMEKYFMYLKQNFSKMNLPILFSFKRNGGFQLYKLLKSYAYPPILAPIDMSLPQEELPYFTRSWDLTNLKMEMGFIDINQDGLKEEASKMHPNFKKMEKEDKQPCYKRWSDLYTRVIEPGIAELNEISDLYIKDVIKDTAGKGGRVEGLTFIVQHNKAYYERINGGMQPQKKEPLTDEQRDDFVDELAELFDETIKTKDRRAIAEAACYDLDKITYIYKMSKKSNNINNLVGWIIKGLKDDYTESVHPYGDHGFKERVYDYDELEDLAKQSK